MKKEMIVFYGTPKDRKALQDLAQKEHTSQSKIMLKLLREAYTNA